jgi:hypothetical protein
VALLLQVRGLATTLVVFGPTSIAHGPRGPRLYQRAGAQSPGQQVTESELDQRVNLSPDSGRTNPLDLNGTYTGWQAPCTGQRMGARLPNICDLS